jgi:hypothetical protein
MHSAPDPILTPADEELLLALIEGEAVDEARAQRLLASHPQLAGEVAAMQSDRVALVTAGEVFAPDWMFAQTIERFESEHAPLQLQHMDPPRVPHRPLRLSASAARTLAAAAAVAILSGVMIVAWVQRPVRTTPTGPIADNFSHDGVAGDQPEPDGPAGPSGTLAHQDSTADAALFQTLVEQHWAQGSPTAEPSLDEGIALLAEGRLVVRVLAVSTETATVARAALDAGLPAESTAWAIAGKLRDSARSVLDRPTPLGPVYAMDAETGREIEVPSPRTLDAWQVQVDHTPQALASVLHTLREQGLIVRMEATALPVPLQPPLDGALWWELAPSTWQPRSGVPIVLDGIER